MCAELCGVGHSRMWGEVVVLEADRFERWLAGEDVELAAPAEEPATLAPERAAPPARESLAERGLRIAAEHGCFNCHTNDGTTHLGPTWRGLYGSAVPLAGGDTVLATPEYLTESMMDPQAKVVAGFAPIMPTFRGQLEPAAVAALIEYIRSIRRPAAVTEPSRTGAASRPESRANASDTSARGAPPAGRSRERHLP